MNHNSSDKAGLHKAAMYYAQLDDWQMMGEMAAARAQLGELPPHEDFVHPAILPVAGLHEIRSWAVQPSTPVWHDQAADLTTEDAENVNKKAAGVSRWIRWLRFNAVGAMGIGVQIAALFLLKSVAHLNYLAATAFAVEAAVVHNFFWHERFTWVDRARIAARNMGSRMLRFNLTTGGVSIVGNLVLMKLLAGMAHINYAVANLMAIALCSLANFVASDEWVFAEETPRS